LRPWGEAGPLVSEPAAYADYLAQHAELWEKQAMLKARPIAGSANLGTGFLNRIRPLLFTASETQVLAGVQAMKSRIEQRLKQRGKLYSEVKLGAGSIRDIEFLAQALQLIHGLEEPRVLTTNTLDALVRQAEFGLISAQWYRQLRTGYVFLRTVEHSLQLLHNQQTHELPTDAGQLQWLANRLDYPDAATLMARFEEHRVAVRTIFEQCLQAGSASLSSSDSGTSRHEADPSAAAFAATAWSQDESSDRVDLLRQHADRLSELAAKAENTGGCTVEQFLIGQPAGTQRPGRFASEAAEDLRDLLVVGVDFSGWLSVICGLLSIYQLDIRSGDAATGEGLRGLWERRPEGYFAACFRVRTATRPPHHNAGPAETPKLADQLQQEISRLGSASREGRIEEVRAELISRFCAAVPESSRRITEAEDSELTVELTPLPGTVLTEMKICGKDSWGFFYELASALSLSRFRVLRAVIRSDGQQDATFCMSANATVCRLPAKNGGRNCGSQPHSSNSSRTGCPQPAIPTTLCSDSAIWCRDCSRQQPGKAIRNHSANRPCCMPWPEFSESVSTSGTHFSDPDTKNCSRCSPTAINWPPARLPHSSAASFTKCSARRWPVQHAGNC
jgi:glutamate-ammonia-ligase adenylyltransferase